MQILDMVCFTFRKRLKHSCFSMGTDFLLQRTGYRASISTLNKRLSADYTVSDLMNATLELDRHNTAALLDYYELLTLRNSINRMT